MEKIILTGSSGLIGKKVSNYLKKKYKLVLIDKKNGFNLNDEVHVKNIFKKHKNANYLINLHGMNDHIEKKRKIKNNDKEVFMSYYMNNVFSVYLTNKYFIKFCNRGKGIVNFASMYGMMSPKHFIYDKPKDIFYVSSKFSVIGLTKYFASLYGKKVNVNCILNGGVLHNQPQNFITKINQHIPKKRMMNVPDLFGVLELLCSDKSKYINGSSIVIDGGYSSW